MKTTTVIQVVVVHHAVGTSLAYPGMKTTLDDILLHARQSSGAVEMLGDLVTTADRDLSTTGKAIKAILEGQQSPEDHQATYNRVPSRDSRACREDTCCIWKHIADEMYNKFHGESGRCNKFARQAVRLGFHDAATWSKAIGKDGGGADGSILLANELGQSEHNGLQDIGTVVRGWYNKYRQYDVTMADLIQVGANVAAVTCPLGPRTRTFVGRKDSSRPAPKNLLPKVDDSPDALVRLFRDKTISAEGLIALVGAHTTSQQHFVDPSRAGAPQDSTPGVWDVAFYGQTKARVSLKILKFESDIALSNFSQTSRIWDAFTGPRGQQPWNTVRMRFSVADYSRRNESSSSLLTLTFYIGICPRVHPRWPARRLQYQQPHRVYQSLTKGCQRLQG
jgi:manganese peroxidase